MVIYFHPDVVPDMEHAWPDRRVLRLGNVDTDFVYAVINGSVLAVGDGPSGAVYLFPLLNQPNAERPDATLIANYVSFITEASVIAMPAEDDQRPSPSWPVVGLHLTSSELFAAAQDALLDAAVGLRWSPHLIPYLPWDPLDGLETTAVADVSAAAVELGQFTSAADCLSLYALSVRQVDPFAEYLFLYRLFEYVSRSNGKNWIQEKLPQLGAVNIGEVRAEFDGLYGGVEIPDRFVAGVDAEIVREGPHHRKLVNLTRLIEALAIERRDTLRGSLTDEQIATRLYEDQRCGLAHANPARSFLLHDSTRDVAEVLLDLPLVRYLARAAVCEVAER